MKIKDLLKITGVSLIGVLGVGLSIFGSAKGMTLLVENYSQVSAYSVNENINSVTFTKEELNNCSYSYLQPLDTDMTNSYVNYNNENFTYEGLVGNKLVFDWIEFDLSTGKWDNGDTFEYSLTIYSSYFAENMQKSITLSASQLNGNTYEYFANQLNELSSDTQLLNSYVIYNNQVCNFVSYDIGSNLSYEIEEDINIQIFLDSTSEYYAHWYINDNIEGELLPFTSSITIYSTYIADNLYAPNNPSSLLQIIVGLLTGGITGIASGVGSGVSTLTTQIFISNNALSVFGGMIVVFAAISLAIGLCRWIMQFLTSLGAKK